MAHAKKTTLQINWMRIYTLNTLDDSKNHLKYHKKVEWKNQFIEWLSKKLKLYFFQDFLTLWLYCENRLFHKESLANLFLDLNNWICVESSQIDYKTLDDANRWQWTAIKSIHSILNKIRPSWSTNQSWQCIQRKIVGPMAI